MSTDAANIYESKNSRFNQETERLSTFDLPNSVSVEAIGNIGPNIHVLDVGAGPNTSLFSFVQSHGGEYTALDKNPEFLEKQKSVGAKTALGDVRALPFEDESFDVSHARFVIAHLGEDKEKSLREVLRVTKPSGRAIIIDYDWSTANGTEVFEAVKDFMIHGGFLFDADFGGELEALLTSVAGRNATVARKDYTPTKMIDYSQVLKLREAGIADLKLQGRAEAVNAWTSALDALQKESEGTKPPGFLFPGMTVAIATKN